MGFTWPLHRGDESMCVGFINELDGFYNNVIYSHVVVHTPLGYVRANQRWWLAVEGSDIVRHGSSGQNCEFAHPEAVTDTFSDDQSSTFGMEALGCWFRNLGPIYEHTRPVRVYPPVPGDADTLDAAAINVMSHLEANQYHWGADSIADTYFGLTFTGLEILVVGDRH